MIERSQRRQVGGFKSSRPDVASRIGKFGYISTQTAMKTHGLILLSALLIAALMMHGQEAAPPTVDLFPEQEEEEASPTPPPNGPELPELKQLDDSFKPKSLGKDADALQVHALWRQLKNRTVNDPEVQAAKKYAQAARTDLEKRKRLSDYYEVYYKRMSALATTPELKVALQQLKDVHQGTLAQPRVRPSPTPEPSGTPSPTPTSTPFKKKEKHKKTKLHK
jgi:hypothetical protein